MERETGFEPATSSLGSWHSTTELLPLSMTYATCFGSFVPLKLTISSSNPTAFLLLSIDAIARFRRRDLGRVGVSAVGSADRRVSDHHRAARPASLPW